MNIIQLFGLDNTNNNDAPEDAHLKYKKDYNNYLCNLLNTNIIDGSEHTTLIKFFETGGPITSINKYNNLLSKIANDNFLALCRKIFTHLEELPQDISNKIIEDSNISELTKDQKTASNNIFKFLQDDTSKTYGLYGYSGSGKSTLITKLIHYLIKNNYLKSVVFAAPTNKAVNVLKSKFKEDLDDLVKHKTNILDISTMSFEEQLVSLEGRGIKIHFQTVHKLLDYKNEFSVNGDRIFVKGKKSLLKNYDFAVVDECSMISYQIITDIFEDIRDKPSKVLFVGDNAQLPPVNEKTSIIFSKDLKDFNLEAFKKIMPLEDNYFESLEDNLHAIMLENLQKDIFKQESITLKEVVRSSNTKVVGLCNDIRSWVIGLVEQPRIGGFKGNKVKLYKLKKQDRLGSKWFKQCLTNFKTAQISNSNSKSSSNIILTWTNNQSNIYNNAIREKLFEKGEDELDTFEIGDILVLNDFYNIPESLSKSNKKKSRLYTSEQIKVIDTEQITKVVPCFSDVLPDKLSSLKYFVGIYFDYKKMISSINKSINRNYNVWKLTVENLAESNKKDSIPESYNMYVIKDESSLILKDDNIKTTRKIKEFRRYCNGMFKDNIKTIDKEIIKPLWAEWSKRFSDPFANVKYGASMSTHKSQGSSFYNVFVDIDDILKNRNNDEAKRCLYTAITRTSNELHILI